MKKLPYSLVQILSLVLAGLFVIVAVSVGYVVLLNIFSAIFIGLSFIIGAAAAGFGLGLVVYILFIAAIMTVLTMVFQPNVFLIPIANSILRFFNDPMSHIKKMKDNIVRKAKLGFNSFLNLFRKTKVYLAI